MSYWDTVNSAVGYWPLQEISGSVADDITGNGHSGTLSNLAFDLNTTTGPTNWLPNALEADGTTLQQVVISDDVDLRGGNQVTLSAWIDMAIDGTIVPISKGSGIIEKDYSIIKYETNHTSFPSQSGYYSETGGTDYRVMATYPAGSQWLHVVVSYDNANGNTATYFNGTLVAAGSTPGESASTDSPVTFFTLPYETTGRAGALAGIGMWDRVLTPLEVNDLFVGPIPTVMTNPSISGLSTIGAMLDLQLANWNHHGYQVISETSYLEVSDDGTSNWHLQAGTENITSFSLPTSLKGKYIRLASAAENEVGVSETYYSESLFVIETPWSVISKHGQVAVTGMAQGQVNLEAGQTAGLVIPGGRE